MSTKIQQLTLNKRIGRPKSINTASHGRVSFVLGPLTKRIEAYQVKAGCTTRSEAVRDLLRIGLMSAEKED